MGYIYKITNKINGKVYIGKTSYTISRRWNGHVTSSFRLNDPGYNMYIHNAIRKYGVEAFSVEQIEECDNSILDEREVYWISEYGSMKNGYNLTLGGEGSTLYSDEEILKAWNKGDNLGETSKKVGITVSTLGIRLRALGVSDNEIIRRAAMSRAKKNSTAVYQYDIDGNYIASFPSITDAESYIGVESITAVITGRSNVCGGYQWRTFKTDKIEPYRRGSDRLIPVYQYTMDGEYVGVHKSVAHAAEAMGHKIGNLYEVCHGRKRSFAGYQWSYEKHDRIPPIKPINRLHPEKRVAQYDLDHNLICIHDSIADAARSVNAAHATISEACRGLRKVSKGYMWEYVDEPTAESGE